MRNHLHDAAKRFAEEHLVGKKTIKDAEAKETDSMRCPNCGHVTIFGGTICNCTWDEQVSSASKKRIESKSVRSTENSLLSSRPGGNWSFSAIEGNYVLDC